jgi:hypothetical protein
MIINPSGNVGTGMVFNLGHMYMFGENMSFSQIQYVKDITDGGTYTN